jgi:nonsense-mediated mRNA decay protein 3
MPRSSASSTDEPASESGAGEFCVLCGRTGLPLENGVCADCFADRHALVTAPPHVEVVICPQCGARQVGRHWERRGESPLLGADDLLPFLRPEPEVGIRRVRWEEISGPTTLKRLHGDVAIRFRGQERTVPVDLEARLVGRTCPECSRRSGRFYTAIVQLRGPTEGGRAGRTPRELRERLAYVWDATIPLARPAWRYELAWTERRPEGWDHYFLETLAARGVARLFRERYAAEVKESASLYGRKDGRDVYRVTFAVRLPAHLPGDLFEEAGAVYRLDRRSPKGAFEMVNVSTGGRSTWPPARLTHARDLGGPERRAVVRARRADADRIEAQRPESGEWAPLLGAPPGSEAAEVSVIPDGDRLWYAGPAAGRRPLER